MIIFADALSPNECQNNNNHRESMPFKYVSDGTILKHVKQLENNKVVGHDGLSAKFFKPSGISPPTSLCVLINGCVMFSHFPVDMKLAEISPVDKKWKVYVKIIIDL